MSTKGGIEKLLITFTKKGKIRIIPGFNKLIDKIPIDTPNDWERYVNEPLTKKELEKLHRSENCQSPYSQEEWQRMICQQLGLESTIREKGRPKKNEEVKKK